MGAGVDFDEDEMGRILDDAAARLSEFYSAVIIFGLCEKRGKSAYSVGSSGEIRSCEESARVHLAGGIPTMEAPEIAKGVLNELGRRFSVVQVVAHSWTGGEELATTAYGFGNPFSRRGMIREWLVCVDEQVRECEREED